MHIRIKENQRCGVCGDEKGIIWGDEWGNKFCPRCEDLYEKFSKQLDYTIKTIRARFNESIVSRIRKHLQTINKDTDPILPGKRND